MRFAVLVLLAVLASVATVTSPSTASAQASNRIEGEKRAYFRDWLAACRPGGYCSTLAYVNPDSWRADHWLRVGSVASGADYEILFVGVAAHPSDQAVLEFRVDGKSVARLEPQADLGWSREPEDALNEFRVSQSVANLTLLPAMRRGARITIFVTEPGEKPAAFAEFSLMGLSAALRWMERRRLP